MKRFYEFVEDTKGINELAWEIVEAGVDPYELISNWLELNEGWADIGQGIGRMAGNLVNKAKAGWGNIKQGWQQSQQGQQGQGGNLQGPYQQAVNALQGLMRQLPQGSSGSQIVGQISSYLQQQQQQILGGGQQQGQNGQNGQQAAQQNPAQAQSVTTANAGNGGVQTPAGFNNWSKQNQDQWLAANGKKPAQPATNAQGQPIQVQQQGQNTVAYAHTEYEGTTLREQSLRIAGVRG